jgi:NhaP-type Na+/H+ or K+/H+ antiporter
MVGTIISFVVLSLQIIFWNNFLFSENPTLRLLPKECLLLASILCATDTVAALTIVKEKKFPTLNSILFGEGVVNDAVSILLFRAVERMIAKDVEEQKTNIDYSVDHSTFQMSFEDISFMFIHFLWLSFCSILVGISFGLLCALV